MACCGRRNKKRGAIEAPPTYRASGSNSSKFVMIGANSTIGIDTPSVNTIIGAGQIIRIPNGDAQALIESGAPIWIL